MSARQQAEKGELKVPIDEVFPLKRVADAHEKSRTGRARGKIVIRVRD